MAGFQWAGDLNGHKSPILRECYIPASTVVSYGEPVGYTPGTGVVKLTEALAEDFDDPIFGVAAENHDGTTSGRQSGTKILISVSPTAVYKYRCTPIIALTGGSTTTAVNSNLLPNVDHFWKNGAIQIVSCAADSSLNGRIVKISDSTGSSGTLTLAETLPAALAASDTIRLCPGNFADNFLGFDLYYNTTNIATATALLDLDFTSDGGAIVRVRYSNPETLETFIVFEKSAVAS